MTTAKSSRLHFLDGIRGWGAFIVMLYHLFINVFQITAQDKILYLYRIFIFNGSLAIWIFFLASGFSLSIQYCQTKDIIRLKQIALARYLRLTIPILIVCFIIYLIMKLGLLLPLYERAPFLKLFLGFTPNFKKMVSYATFCVFTGTCPHADQYISPLWTMTYEFWGSCLVLTTLAVIGNLSKKSYLYGILIFISIHFSLFYTAFLLGLVMAEIYSQSALLPNLKNNLVKISKLLIVFSFGLTFFIKIISTNYMSFVTASLIFFCLIYNPSAIKFLSSNISQYLGKVSYPLYLIHVIIFNIYTNRIYNFFSIPSSGFSWLKLFINFSTVVICLVIARLLVPIDLLGIKMGKKFSEIFLRSGDAQDQINPALSAQGSIIETR